MNPPDLNVKKLNRQPRKGRSIAKLENGARWTLNSIFVMNKGGWK